MSTDISDLLLNSIIESNNPAPPVLLTTFVFKMPVAPKEAPLLCCLCSDIMDLNMPKSP